MKIGFDHEKYLEEQSKYILERVNNHDKLYIEFGGKLLGDLHAKRVLPGFDENAKIKVLNKLKDKIEVIMVEIKDTFNEIIIGIIISLFIARFKTCFLEIFCW